MFDKIRAVFSRTPKPTNTYTPEELRRIGQALGADRTRLAEIRRLSVEEAAPLYPGYQ